MVVPERPIHFDSLVAAAAFKTAQKAGEADPLQALDDLPFAKQAAPSGAWVWQASQIHLHGEGGVFWNHYVRKFEMARWAGDKLRGVWTGNKSTIAVGTGQQKAFSLNQPLQHIAKAVAYCVGDKDIIQALLESEIHALGRNIRMGWGRIHTLEVTDADPGENDLWRQRALPREMDDMILPGHFLGTANVRPPYFDRESWQTAWEYEASAPVASAAS
jgi:CRISPR type IV-associated protein Csf3